MATRLFLFPKPTEEAGITIMATAKDKLGKIRALVEGVVSGAGFELVDAEMVPERGQQILRLYIDTIPPGTRESGVTVEHCSTVSRAVSDVLDNDETIDGEYTLEVSSPGLFRPLTKADHFDRAVGQRVKVKTYEKIDNRRMFTGILRRIDGGKITVAVDGVDFAIDLEKVAKANLEPEL